MNYAPYFSPSQNDLFELACDNCGDTIEEEDLGELSVLYETVSGRKANAGVYCKGCIQ